MTSTSISVVEQFLGAADLDSMAELIHPEAIISAAAGFSYSGDWFGPQGLRDLVAELYGQFRLRIVDSELHDTGNGLVLFLANSAFTSRKTGRSAETRVCELYRVHNDLIIGADLYYKDPAAVRALLDV